MKAKRFERLGGRRTLMAVALGAMLLLGSYLLSRSLPSRPFTEKGLIYDLIWLDAWALLFLFSIAAVWITDIRWRVKAPILVACLTVHGVVTTALIFSGTPFGTNAYWGDQSFHVATIVKFMSFGWFTDFYYKDLPPFYPPVYYYILSLYGRVFSVEAYKMIKIGMLGIYLFGPALLFLSWKKLVSPFRAFLITMASFMFCWAGTGSALFSAHGFLASSFFVPWWLYYVEQATDPREGWRYYVAGGLVGGLIFSTYFYPFFIGGLLLLIRSLFVGCWGYLKGGSTCNLRKAWLILACAAGASAPYWLPVLYSIAANGLDRSRGGWHHIGTTGLSMPFLDFSVAGALFLLSIVYALNRPNPRLYKGLLLILGTTMFFYLIGAHLGAIDRPVNLIKAKMFLTYLAGPLIGLMLAAVIRRGRLRKKARYAVAILSALLMITFLHQANAQAKHGLVKRARTSQIAGVVKKTRILENFPGSVILCNNKELYAFLPVFAFVSVNEHYSHPASQFIQRYRFLHNLQAVHDPPLFNLALRHNRFDAVDFFMPRMKDGAFEILLALSNYPNRWAHQTLRYDLGVVSDTTFFQKEQGDNLYRVLDTGASKHEIRRDFVVDADWGQLMRLRMLYNDLDDAGRTLMEEQVGSSWNNWHSMITDDGEADFDDRIELLEAYAVPENDSLHLLFAFYVADHFDQDYKCFVHVYPGHGESSFDNYDFAPKPGVRSWEKGNIVICKRTIPNHDDDAHLHLGLFKGKDRMGDGTWLTLR